MKPLLGLLDKALICRLLAGTAALVVLIAVPPAASAQTVRQQIVTQPGAPHRLSTKTLSQISALEAEADARTPAQQKINSQLLFTLKTARGQVIAPGVPTQRTSVVVDGTGMTLVDIDGTISPALLAAIRQAGGTVVGSSVRFGQLRALVPLGSVETLAALPDVRQIKPAVKSQLQNPAPVHSGTGMMQRKSEVLTHLPSLLSQVDVNVQASRLLGINFADSGSASGVGSFTDEGDSTHQANTARSAYGISGSGIKVGVLSDSLDNGNGIYSDALNSGDVSPVTVISGQSGGAGTGEGLAMLEVVHHLAPGAQLYFATGAAGEGQFADNIIALQQAGCKVIIDDEGYSDESPFQDDVIAQAINTVTANGAMYFSSAANNGNLVNQTSSVWENDYVDSGDYTFPNGSSDGEIHQFDDNGDEEDYINASGNGTKTQVGQTLVSLFWTDPLGKSTNDYDLFILDGSGSVVSSSTDRQTGSQDPYEQAMAVDGDYAVIVQHSGSTRYLHLDLDDQHCTLGIQTTDRTRGHNAAANAFCVAATPATTGQDGNPAGPYPNPFNSSDVVETFSDDGPREVYFSANGTPFTSSLTSTGGKSLNKPDFTAADGTTTTLTPSEVGTDSSGKAKEALSPFFGTSCAAPHAGAIAALVLSYNPSLTRAQLATILKNSATDIMASGYDLDAGAGILNAYKALQNTPAPTTAAALSSLSFSPASGFGGSTSPTGTVTLTSAATAATTVTLSSPSASLVVPSSVTVSAGSTSATFTATSHTVTTATAVTVTATSSGVSKTGTFTVNPTYISALAFNPASVTGGSANSTGTVTLAGAVGSAQTITLTSSNTAALTVPSSLSIPYGTTSGTFTATSHSVTAATTVTVTASYNGGSKTATVTVNPAATAPALASLTFSPTSGFGGSTSPTGTVTLTSAATAATTVTLSSPSASLVVPSSVTVSAGSTSATFTATSHTVTTATAVTVTATSSGVSKTGTFTVNPTYISALAFNPASVTGGSANSTGTVTLAGAVGSAQTITLTSSNTAALTVPSSLSIPYGTTSGTFTATSHSVTAATTVTVTASYNGGSKTATVTVNPASSGTVTPKTLSFNPNPAYANSLTTGTVTLTAAAPAGGLAVTISSVSGSTKTNLITVTVPANQTSMTFSLETGYYSTQTTLHYSADANGGSAAAVLTVNPTTVQLASLTITPNPVSSSSFLTAVVTLSAAAPTGGAGVKVSLNGSLLGVLTVPDGKTTQSIMLFAPQVTAATVDTYSAYYNNVTKNVSVTVNP